MKNISANVLKIVAMVAMLIDHIGYTIIGEIARIQPDPKSFERVKNIYELSRNIGRISFPLFCFLLVEGFFRTSSRKKYILRLVILAFLSEIPFDLMLYRKPIDFSGSNVAFTLLGGMICIWVIESCIKKYEMYQAMGVSLSALLVVFAAIHFWIKSDYGVPGVLCIIIMYFGAFYIKWQGYAAAIIIYTITMHKYAELWALCSVPLIMGYNGKQRQKKSTMIGGFKLSYLWYLFYPVHMLILVWIRSKL